MVATAAAKPLAAIDASSAGAVDLSLRAKFFDNDEIAGLEKIMMFTCNDFSLDET